MMCFKESIFGHLGFKILIEAMVLLFKKITVNNDNIY